MIPISCGPIGPGGKPGGKGGPEVARPSGSRFVLPFAYRPVLQGNGGEDTRRELCYRPSKHEDDLGRRTYPTAETARVLFQRAGWFELGAEGKEVLPPFQVKRHSWGPGGGFQARIERVRLVLFEWEHETRRALEPLTKARKRDRQEKLEPDLLATGFLLLDVSFDDSQGPVYLDDLLAFNELFRYIRQPYPEHDEEKGYRTVLGDLPLDPENPRRRLRDSGESDGYQGRWAHLLNFEVQDRDKRWRLFPTGEAEDWNARALAWLDRGEPDQPSGWAIYADNRAYVSTCAMVEGGLDALQAAFPDGDRKASRFGHWIRLLNIDLPESRAEKSHTCSAFEREWAEERTYQRWQHLGTVYGFTYHGAALLGPAHPDYKVDAHWRTVYFDQTLLLLYLRVTSFRFSRALSEASGANLRRDGGKGEVLQWQRRFQELRHSFAVFTNLYEFPLVSNQQQGIELFALARKTMDVNELFREVREEILATHEYFESVATQVANESVARLTLVAAVLGTGALVTGFFGMNLLIHDLETSGPPEVPWRWALLVVLFASLLGLWGMRWVLRAPQALFGRKLLEKLFPGLLPAKTTEKKR